MPVAIFLKKMTIFGNYFLKMSSFLQFFDSQMAIFRRVSSVYLCSNKTVVSVVTSQRPNLEVNRAQMRQARPHLVSTSQPPDASSRSKVSSVQHLAHNTHKSF